MPTKKKSVLVVTGTRAEYGLLKPVIQELQTSKVLIPRVLVTGMHTLRRFGYTLHDIRHDKMPVTRVVPVGENDSMLTALSKEIRGIEAYCLKHRPDIILVLGDRDEPFAAAIIGGHLKIPVAHIHGGDVTGYVVDEPIRHSITKFSHLHFPVTRKSYQRVLKLGEEPWRVINAGSTALDTIDEVQKVKTEALAHKLGIRMGVPWFVVVHHPTPLDNVDFRQQIAPLFSVLSHFEAEKIVIFPNSDTGNEVFIREINTYSSRNDFHTFKTLDREYYIKLLMTSRILIGNSSSGIIESTFFKLPTINIGHRQDYRERGANILDCDYSAASINTAIKKASSPQFLQRCRTAKSPYGSGKASKKIVAVIEKHIDNPRLFSKKNTYAKII